MELEIQGDSFFYLNSLSSISTNSVASVVVYGSEDVQWILVVANGLFKVLIAYRCFNLL